jgi:hypothetical protein
MHRLLTFPDGDLNAAVCFLPCVEIELPLQLELLLSLGTWFSYWFFSSGVDRICLHLLPKENDPPNCRKSVEQRRTFFSSLFLTTDQKV